MMLSSVLLPEPDGPISATNSPRSQHEIDVVQDLDLDRRADVVGLADAFEAQDFVRSQPRIATTGSSFAAARSAGTAAAATPVTAASRTASDEQRRLKDEREQLAAVGLAQIGMPERPPQTRQRPRRRPIRRNPSSPPCSRNTRRICPRDGAHGAQDADVLRALDHRDDEHAGDAEGDRQADEDADERVGGLLGVHGREELGIGLDPAVGLDAGGRLNGLRDRLGGVDVVDREVDASLRRRRDWTEPARCASATKVER